MSAEGRPGFVRSSSAIVSERAMSPSRSDKLEQKDGKYAGPGRVAAVREGEALQRQMKTRHGALALLLRPREAKTLTRIAPLLRWCRPTVTMISLGGAIGTGLFLSVATALQNGGPVRTGAMPPQGWTGD